MTIDPLDDKMTKAMTDVAAASNRLHARLNPIVCDWLEGERNTTEVVDVLIALARTLTTQMAGVAMICAEDNRRAEAVTHMRDLADAHFDHLVDNMANLEAHIGLKRAKREGRLQ